MVQTVGVGTAAIDAAFTAGDAMVSEVAEAVASAASISRLLFPLLLLSALDVILASSLLFLLNRSGQGGGLIPFIFFGWGWAGGEASSVSYILNRHSQGGRLHLYHIF